MINLFGKNDWYPVWCEIGHWQYRNPINHIKTSSSTCEYTIIFSPSRKQYKLKLSGDSPKSNSVYLLAVQKLNEFIANGHN